MIELILLAAFPCLCLYSGISDFLTMKIPNWITIALIAVFFIVAIMQGISGSAILLHHISAAVILFIIGFAFFSMGWMGGGDAKILTGIALWYGLSPILLQFLLIASISGGLLTALLLMFRLWKKLPPVLARRQFVVRLHKRQNGVPFGVAIAAAALLVYPQSEWYVPLSAFL